MMSHRGNDRGVSTIIATILMVAITVVLAGVLYVMIIGLGGGGGDDLTPLGSGTEGEAVSNTSAELTFGAMGSEVGHIDIKIFLAPEGHLTEITLDVPGEAEETDCVIAGHGLTIITATFSDYDWEKKLINGGDKITIHGLAPGEYYVVEVLHVPTSSIIYMTGVDNGFQIPP